MGCHALLLGIFPTQGWVLSLLCPLHWQTGSLPLAPLGKSPVKFFHPPIIQNTSYACLCEYLHFTAGVDINGFWQGNKKAFCGDIINTQLPGRVSFLFRYLLIFDYFFFFSFTATGMTHFCIKCLFR